MSYFSFKNKSHRKEDGDGKAKKSDGTSCDND